MVAMAVAVPLVGTVSPPAMAVAVMPIAVAAVSPRHLIDGAGSFAIDGAGKSGGGAACAVDASAARASAPRPADRMDCIFM